MLREALDPWVLRSAEEGSSMPSRPVFEAAARCVLVDVLGSQQTTATGGSRDFIEQCPYIDSLGNACWKSSVKAPATILKPSFPPRS